MFAAILDDKKGGFFQIAPADDDGTGGKQFYWPDTNVLVTRFLQSGAAAELIDFMPVGEDSRFATARRQVIRRVTVARGRLDLRMRCKPAFNYARDPHQVVLVDHGAEFRSANAQLGLASSVPLRVEDDAVVAEFSLEVGETATFVLRELGVDESAALDLSDVKTEAAFREAVAYWRKWLSQSTYKGRWREIVDRSALALKLLTYEPTGAIVAAPTCSLPEGIGGERNWDYRYTWLRDSAFTVLALLRLGFTKEAANFGAFLQGVFTPAKSGRLPANHVRDRRSSRSLGGDPRPSRRLHGLATRPDRQRGLQSAPAGHLRRGHRRLYLFNKHVQPIGPGPLADDQPRGRLGCATTGSARTQASGRCGVARRIFSTPS